MVAAAIEAVSEQPFDVGSQLHEAAVAAEIGGGLTRCPAHISIHFLLRHGLTQRNFLGEDPQGYLGGELAALEPRIEIRPGGPEQPVLERDQLRLQRQVGLHLGFGVERPAFDVDTIQREEGPGLGNPSFHHGRHLQLVARPALVDHQAPGRGVVGEVVVAQIT